MDQLMAIKAFARVVEAGNFTRAADSLDMPNATLSKLVQELEAAGHAARCALTSAVPPPATC